MSHATPHVEDRLLDFAYGELSAQDARDVESHLAGCANCKAQLEDIQGVRKVMSHLPESAAPAAGLDSLLAYAEQAARRAQAGPPPKAAWWRRWILPVAGVATAAVAFFVVTDAIEGRGLGRELEQAALQEARPEPTAAAAPPLEEGAFGQAELKKAAAPPAQAKDDALLVKLEEAANVQTGAPVVQHEPRRELDEVVATEELSDPNAAYAPRTAMPGDTLAGRGATAGGGELSVRGGAAAAGPGMGMLGGAPAGPSGSGGGRAEPRTRRDQAGSDGFSGGKAEEKGGYAERVAAPSGASDEGGAKKKSDRAMFGDLAPSSPPPPVTTAAPAPSMQPAEPPAPPARAPIKAKQEAQQKPAAPKAAAKSAEQSRGAVREAPAADDDSERYAMDAPAAEAEAERAESDAVAIASTASTERRAKESAADASRLLDQADAAARNGQPSQAVALAEAALRESPNALAEQRALRILCENHPDFDQAQRRCQQLIAKYPKSGAAQVARKRMAAPHDADAADAKRAAPAGSPAPRPANAAESAPTAD